jgi:hypothetical protein
MDVESQPVERTTARQRFPRVRGLRHLGRSAAGQPGLTGTGPGDRTGVEASATDAGAA